MNKLVRFGYFTQLALSVLLLVALAVAISSWASYQQIKTNLLVHLSSELLNIINTLSPSINGDEHENIFLLEPGEIEGKDEFNHIQKLLAKVSQKTGLIGHQGSSPIYTLRKAVDFNQTKELEFVVMSHRDSSGKFFTGNRIRIEPHQVMVFAGRTVITELYEDSEGLWISAAAPIFDSDENVIAIIQADRPVTFYQREAKSEVIKIAKSAGISLLIAIIVVLLFSRNFTAPLKQIVDAALKFGDGQLNSRASINRNDEIGVLGATFDQMAEKVESYQQELEKKIDAATSELQTTLTLLEKRNDELILAKQLAEQANKIKSEFLSNMSHELRTPLNAILGYSELLIEETKEQGKNHDLDDLKSIHSSGAHLLSIVNNILDLNKVETGKIDLVIEEFDIGTLIKSVITTIKPLLNEGDNHLEIRCPAESYIESDIVKIRQILINLISNAIKFTENGVITLEVSTRHSFGDDWYHIDLRDTGIGIEPKDLETIFDPFTQVDSSITRKYEGTGLGLTLSLRLAKSLGGDLVVESEIGKGSVFSLRIPRHHIQNDQKVEGMSSASA